VQAFADPNGKGHLAVTTQVAEMSLDLDAQLLRPAAVNPSVILKGVEHPARGRSGQRPPRASIHL